jgi:hypothetical protein
MMNTFNRQPREVKHFIGSLTESPIDFGRLACVNKHTSQLLSNWPLELRARQYFTIKERKTYIWGKGIEWRLNGVVHREKDQPAIIYSSGTREWCQHGKYHRDGNQPARITSSGHRYWYQNGKLHRDGDQPALIYANGTQCWYVHGKKIKQTS